MLSRRNARTREFNVTSMKGGAIVVIVGFLCPLGVSCGSGSTNTSRTTSSSRPSIVTVADPPQSQVPTTSLELKYPPVSPVFRRRQLLIDLLPGGPLFPLISAVEQGEDWNGELAGALIEENGAIFLCTGVNEELPPSCAAGVEVVGSAADLSTLVIAHPPRFTALKGVFRHEEVAFVPEF